MLFPYMHNIITTNSMVTLIAYKMNVGPTKESIAVLWVSIKTSLIHCMQTHP